MQVLVTNSGATEQRENALSKSVLRGHYAALNDYLYGRDYALTEEESLAIPARVRTGLAIAPGQRPDQDQTNFADRFAGGATINSLTGYADRASGSSLKHHNNNTSKQVLAI